MKHGQNIAKTLQPIAPNTPIKIWHINRRGILFIGRLKFVHSCSPQPSTSSQHRNCEF